MARKIIVANKAKVEIRVKVQTERERVKTYKERKVTDTNREELFKLVMGGKATLPIKLPISVESSLDLQSEEKVREYFDNNIEVVYELNPFVDEGWDKVSTDSTRNFSLPDGTDIYYLSYIIDNEKMIRGPIQRSEDKVTINERGIVEDKEFEQEIIKTGEHICLQLADGHYVGNPTVDRNILSVKPYGVLGQVNKSTSGKHRLHPIDGSEIINSDSIIRICTADTSVATDGRDNMQGTSGSFKVYYVENADNNQQKWRIEKVGGSGPIKNGDRVKFVNLEWPDNVLTFNENAIERYLSCQEDYGRADYHKIWTIKKV